MQGYGVRPAGGPAASPGMVLAGFWRRALAQAIDLVWILPLVGMGLRGGATDTPALSELLQTLIVALVVLIF
jgi:hypothetical protein